MTTTVVGSNREITDTPPVTTEEVTAEFVSDLNRLIEHWQDRMVGIEWTDPDRDELFRTIEDVYANLADIFFLLAEINLGPYRWRDHFPPLVTYDRDDLMHDHLMRIIDLAETTAVDLQLADRLFGRCQRCGRPLRDRQSRMSGYGPECLKEMNR